MRLNKWLDKTQPQTLVIATIIMYVNAALGLLTVSASLFSLVTVVGSLFAGLGIANEKKWGYWLGVAIPVFVLALTILYFSGSEIIQLLFWGALLALLLHPQSREYRKTWFRW